PDPRGEGAPDPVGDADRSEVGHADARHGADRARAQEPRHDRRGAGAHAHSEPLRRDGYRRQIRHAAAAPGPGQRTGLEAPAKDPSMDIRVLLKEMVDRGASDLYITVDSSPVIRIEGENHILAGETLTPPEVEALANALMTERQRALFEENMEMN